MNREEKRILEMHNKNDVERVFNKSIERADKKEKMEKLFLQNLYKSKGVLKMELMKDLELTIGGLKSMRHIRYWFNL